MAVAMFDEKDICFSAFSLDENGESQSFYRWIINNFKPSSVASLYWGGEEIRKHIPPEIKTIEIAGSMQITQENFLGYNTIIRHPVTRPDLLPTDRDITTMTNEFFARCPAPIIGVTGTKGKGTTVTLISKILGASGRTVHVVGNIGVPAIEVLDRITENDIVVFELSSFQLWDLKYSPHIAVVLMIVAEHMDVHKDMREYVDAKSMITRHQKEDDVVVYHPTNQFSGLIASYSEGKKHKYQSGEGAQVIENNIMIEGQIIMPATEVGLLGAHNLDNICAAITAAWQYTKRLDVIRGAVSEFRGLEHRLEFVDEVNGVRFFNDSFATAPEPTIAAINAIDVPKVLILGGSSKDSNFNQLARDIKLADMRAVVTIGHEGPKIAEALRLAGSDSYILVEAESAKTIDEVVYETTLVAQPGDVVLLSPACASFDMFKNYKERGKLFKEAVLRLKNR